MVTVGDGRRCGAVVGVLCCAGVGGKTGPEGCESAGAV